MKFSELEFVNRGQGGFQAKVHFDNGYGASVIIGPYTYGGRDKLYELAVFRGESICYETPITSNVLGYLTPEEVEGYLAQIEKLTDEMVSAYQKDKEAYMEGTMEDKE